MKNRLITRFGLVLAVACAGLPQARGQGPLTLDDLRTIPVSPAAPAVPAARAEAARTPPQAVPDAAAVKEARKLVRHAYEDDYAAVDKNPGHLSRKLQDAAGQTDNPVRKYALLVEAEEVAATAGNHARAMELITLRGQSFEIDVLQSRLDRLGDFLTPAVRKKPDVLTQLYDHAMETADLAMAEDDLPQARAAADLAGSIARAILLAGKARKEEPLAEDGDAKQARVRELARSIESRTALLDGYKAAVETLKTSPDDPAANGIVGRYLCLARDDWKEGLPALAKGDDEKLAKLAALELEALARNPPDSQQVFTLAGKWWDAAADRGTTRKDAADIKSHASALYASVEDRLADPLDKQVARKRATEGTATVSRGRTKTRVSRRREIALSDLPEQDLSVGYGTFGKDGDLGYDDARMVVRGHPVRKGLSMHPPSRGRATVTYAVPEGFVRLEAIAAINDTAGREQQTPLTFTVMAGDRLLWSSQPLRGGGAAEACDVGLRGAKTVTLTVECPGNSARAHAVWLEPRFANR